MSCYFQGCPGPAVTSEHVPPQSFFPIEQRQQLITVRSCVQHNNAKSTDDIYVLAHICLNSSPKNSSRTVFEKSVLKQLHFNKQALGKLLVAGAVRHPNGAVSYNVDVLRFDRFFTALSCGIICKSHKQQLPANYQIAHIYHNLLSPTESSEQRSFMEALRDFYAGHPAELKLLDFGQVRTWNPNIYSVKIFGVAGFGGSITIVHKFYDAFEVTSMLTRTP